MLSFDDRVTDFDEANSRRNARDSPRLIARQHTESARIHAHLAPGRRETGRRGEPADAGKSLRRRDRGFRRHWRLGRGVNGVQDIVRPVGRGQAQYREYP